MYFGSLLSVTDVKQTLVLIFQYIKCYYQIKKIQINWKVYVYSLTLQQSIDIVCGVNLCIFAYKSLHYHNDADENIRFCKNENLALTIG